MVNAEIKLPINIYSAFHFLNVFKVLLHINIGLEFKFVLLITPIFLYSGAYFGCTGGIYPTPTVLLFL